MFSVTLPATVSELIVVMAVVAVTESLADSLRLSVAAVRPAMVVW